MKFYLFPRIVRALVLVALVAGVLALAAASAAWSDLSDLSSTSGLGRSTVPRNEADLSITKSYRRSGRNGVIFTIVVKNNGPVAAKDAIMTDLISRHLVLESARTNKGSCKGSPAVRCKLGNLAVGQVVTITIRVAIKPIRNSSRIVNTAIIRSKTRDPQKSNNIASVLFRSR
jgi:uncharacterized repeat protein (TIGR01451 family)